MDEYFGEELKNIKTEISAMKTAMRKSAGVIALYNEEINLNVSLESDGGSVPSKIIKISLSGQVQSTLFFITLDKYYDDDKLTPAGTRFGYARHRWFSLRTTQDGLIVRLAVIGTFDDEITIEEGGSVVIPVKMRVSATSVFRTRVL
ncbi:hypothetical protein IJ098_00505 [Candidatus Saccharibacteria bacterium]|nr:hypothetical protein [Candidatus Saccharibacteria bacterium]